MNGIIHIQMALAEKSFPTPTLVKYSKALFSQTLI